MESRQVVRKASTARCVGHLVSAVQTVKRAGANWADTVALGWRLAAEFDQADISEANQIRERLMATQPRPTPGDIRPLSATAKAA